LQSLGKTAGADGIVLGLSLASEETMRAFIATVLSVIAVGVMLIAYGLLNPRTPSADAYLYAAQGARAMPVGQQVGFDDRYGYVPASPYGYATPRQVMAYPANDVRALPEYETYPAPRRAVREQVVTRRVPARSERSSSGRDWTKTAMVIGGTTAAGAGLGAIFGGKKGALIGAAIGGGAGTLYEVKKR
jgi:hypothetical protein